MLFIDVTGTNVFQKVTLPPEPMRGEAGVIAVVLRTPLGRSHRRCFHIEDTIQVSHTGYTSIT